MSYRDTDKKIIAFVVLSFILHGIIILVVAKTRTTEPMVTDIEFMGEQDEQQDVQQPAPQKPQRQAIKQRPRPQKVARQPQPVPKKVVPPPVKQDLPVKAEVATDVKPNQPDSSVPVVMEEQQEKSESPSNQVADTQTEGIESSADVDTAPPSDIADSEESSQDEDTTSQEGVATQDQQEGDQVRQEALQAMQDAQSLEKELEDSVKAEDTSVRLQDVAETEAKIEDSKGTGTDHLAGGGTKGLGDSPQGLPASGVSDQGLKDVPVYQTNQLQLLQSTSIVYPTVSRQLKEVGTARLRVLFDASGNPKKTILLKSTGSKNLDGAAIQGMKTLRFKGLGHPFVYEVPVRFQLEFNDQQLNQFVNYSNESDTKAQTQDNEIKE